MHILLFYIFLLNCHVELIFRAVVKTSCVSSDFCIPLNDNVVVLKFGIYSGTAILLIFSYSSALCALISYVSNIT